MTGCAARHRADPLQEILGKHPAASLAHRVVYESLMWCCNAAAIAAYRFRAYHGTRVPREGPVLIACNHQSFLDPPVVGLGVPHRHLDYIARIGLFRCRPLGWLIRMLNAIPIHQDEPDTAAIREAIARLNRGSAVVVFPEGTRSEDGSLGVFKRGVALLLRRARCPVVPAAIEGTDDAWPRSRPLPHLSGSRVGVIFGEPIPPETLLAEGPDAALDTLRTEIAGLRRELAERMAHADRRAGAGRHGVREAGPRAYA